MDWTTIKSIMAIGVMADVIVFLAMMIDLASGLHKAEVRYTTDGSTPTTESTLYSAALTLTDTTTVKVIAVKGDLKSEVATKTFTKSSGDNGGLSDDDD